MMKQPLVSVIVPVYNVEKYLPRCLDSISSQTYKKWECILVDDGSTDRSGTICDEYAKKDSRFIVHHKKNGGVSSARNHGLEQMKGEWCTFVDADDVLLPKALDIYISNISDELDSILASYARASDDLEVIEKSDKEFHDVIDYESSLKDFYKSRHGMFNGFIWNRLFRSSVITNCNLRFNEKIYIKEDGLFIVEFLCASKRNAYQTSDVVYYYVQNDSSVMNRLSDSFNPKYFTDIDACALCYRIIKQNTQDKELHKMSKDYIFTVHQYIRHHLKKHKIKSLQIWWKLFYKTLKATSLWFVFCSYYKVLKNR